MSAARRRALARAKQRLDRLELYPRPVGLRHVRLFVCPQLFRLPWFRRFDGYALHGTILLRFEPTLDEDLLTHELCHLWQLQHRPIAMPFSYLSTGYDRNRYELEARVAVASTG